MVKKVARPRSEESVGTRTVTRRTVARGMAWTTPVVAVATAAPAFAASPGCVPVISLDLEQSCRCTGNSTREQAFVYFLKFCVTSSCTPQESSGAFSILSVKTNGSGKDLVFDPDNCFTAGGTPGDPAKPGSQTGLVNNCAGNPVLRYNSKSSPIKLDVTFIVNGEQYTQEVISPNDCGTIQEIESRCEGCADGDTVSPGIG